METSDKVLVYEKEIEIPTYGVGLPNKNPMFLEKRVYQGSSGKVYPIPVIDKIYDTKEMRKWKVIILENKYLLIWIMPQLGGRIQRAMDKTNQYEFVYYNRVIKPALVGLAGPWISGGIEFNWPQHHRPSTFSPVEYTYQGNADGSKTVFTGEIDAMYGTKSTVGFTLYPEKAYLEIKVQLYNKTPLPQTFLWWANPAYAVNEHTQSVFPPDVHAVFDHGKRDVSRFPIATGTYYKVDYSTGVDISRYRNIPVPTSYMAYHSDYDFVGGYDHGRQAGLLHVADRHISPGKKQWTWGCGDFGKAWDRNLTDEDGPYIELMTGVYTDNQPDFSWLNPYEEKSFTQYFMPYKDIGIVKNASRDVALNLETEGTAVKVYAYAASAISDAVIALRGRQYVYLEETVDLSPESGYFAEFERQDGDADTDLTVSIRDGDGRLLLSYTPIEKKHEAVPDAARALPDPQGMANNEALYLAGLHLEQYRHATFSPEDYYGEGLKRNPDDIRINNAYGMLLLRRGAFAAAEEYFRRAVKTLTRHNPNPYDSEAYYNLGLVLQYLGKTDQAYESFYKSCWSVSTQDCGYYALAQIDCLNQNYELALEHTEKSLNRNARHYQARDLKAALLRKMKQYDEAIKTAEETLFLDIFGFGAYNELYLAILGKENDGQAAVYLDRLTGLMGGSEKNHMELAIHYMDAGLYAEAADVLKRYKRRSCAGPMVLYYLGWLHEKMDDNAKRDAYYMEGAQASPLYCFPNRLYDYIVLQRVVIVNPKDAKAFYYLGNFMYDRRQYAKAVECFERARELDSSFPTVHRNLALTYYNKQHDPQKAIEAMETAFSLDQSDARVFYELDQLYKKMGKDPAERLAHMEKYPEIIERRDDLYVEYITLLNIDGQYNRAKKLISSHKFHPWEGGEGKITRQHVYTHLEIGKQFLAEKRYAQALDVLLTALRYSENLGEGKLYGAQENDVHYYISLAYRGLDSEEDSLQYLKKASVGLSEPASAIFYNDQPPEMIFYQGLACQALGFPDKAKSRFNTLIDYGERHLRDNVRIDYFAVSLPDFLIFEDDLNKRNVIHCRYMMGLGYIGLGLLKEAAEEFRITLVLEPAHQGVRSHLNYLRPLLQVRATNTLQ